MSDVAYGMIWGAVLALGAVAFVAFAVWEQRRSRERLLSRCQRCRQRIPNTFFNAGQVPTAADMNPMTATQQLPPPTPPLHQTATQGGPADATSRCDWITGSVTEVTDCRGGVRQTRFRPERPAPSNSADGKAEVRHEVAGGSPEPESHEVQLRLGALAVACLGAQSRGVVCGLRLDAYSVETWHDTRAGEHHIARISLRSPTALVALGEAIDRIHRLQK